MVAALPTVAFLTIELGWRLISPPPPDKVKVCDPWDGDLLKMAAGKPLSGGRLLQVCLVLLLVMNAASVSSQFNGYNCDANFHSRYPGEMDTLTADSGRAAGGSLALQQWFKIRCLFILLILFMKPLATLLILIRNS